MLTDLKFAVRMLAKSPGFTFVAVLTLALGIGVNTAIFSLVHHILIERLPFPNSERLYLVWAKSDADGSAHIAASGPDFIDYREQNRSFARIAELTPQFTFTWTGDGEPKLVNCTAASEELFPMLGVRPFLGRLYEPREYTYLQNDTILVSYRFWRNQLGSDPHVLGRVIHFEEETQTIVGVLPPVLSELFPDTDVWPKLTTSPSWAYMQWRENKFLRVIGELRPGVSTNVAEQDLTAILRRALGEPPDVRVQLVSLKDDVVGNVRLPLQVTLAAVWIVLLVTCINIAALLLARAVKRQTEMALRLSLGASQWRITRQLLAEAMLLSALSFPLGLFFGWSGLHLIGQIPGLQLPRMESIHLNLPVLVITAAISIGSTLFFGWVPSMRFSRLDLSSVLQTRGAELGARHRRAFSWLVITEVACSVVLTITVGLLMHSFWLVIHVDPGFRSESVLRVYLRTNYYGPEGRAFWKNVLTETSALPGVRTAAVSDWRPGKDAATATLFFDDRTNDPNRLPPVDGSWVSAEFFRTIGTPLIAGRYFSEHDDPNTPAVAIINTEAARQYWPGQNPVGRRIGVNYTGPGRTSGSAPRMREIVGIVGSIKHGPLDAPTSPAVYMPYLQDETNHDMASMSLLVRTDGNPMGLADSLRARIHSIRPDQPVQNIRSMEELMSESLAPRRYTLLLVGAFASLVLLLVAVGIYGVVSYITAQRTREFGIRIALGATRGRVVSDVLRHALLLTAIGSAFGIGAALFITSAFSKLLFEVNPVDAFSFSGALGLLAVISIFACLLPAWRACHVDPIAALRYE
jgi:putative ABC transport system permease protein